jgi:hypothetical protein
MSILIDKLSLLCFVKVKAVNYLPYYIFKANSAVQFNDMCVYNNSFTNSLALVMKGLVYSQYRYIFVTCYLRL